MFANFQVNVNGLLSVSVYMSVGNVSDSRNSSFPETVWGVSKCLSLAIHVYIYIYI